jgi:hypothetical protein
MKNCLNILNISYEPIKEKYTENVGLGLDENIFFFNDSIFFSFNNLIKNRY